MKVGLVGLPVLAYGLLMLTCKFPVNERVTAGVSFRDMLKEVGLFGAFLVSLLIVFELSNVLGKFGVPVGTDAVIGNLPAIGEITNAQAVSCSGCTRCPSAGRCSCSSCSS
jgi:uncharacterized membrane protein